MNAAQDRSHSYRSRRRALGLVAVGMFSVTMASNAPSPLYVVYERRFAFSAQSVTYVFAAYAVGVMLALIMVGRLSDQLGRRKVMIPALLLVDVGAVLFATATGLGSLVAARAVQGLATGAFTAAGTASLMELSGAEDKRAASTLNTVSFVGGAAAGPLLFGALIQYAPWPRQLPFAVEGLLVTVSAAMLTRIPETVTRDHSTGRRIRRPSVPRPIRLLFAASAVAVALSWGVGALYGALSPSIDGEVLHVRTHVAAGAVLAVFYIVAGLSQVVWRGWTSWRAMVVGVAALASGMVVLGWCLAVRSVALFIVATVLAGAGAGLAFMGSMGLLNNSAPADKRAEVVAAYNVCGYIALSVPILGVGALAARVGLTRASEVFAAGVVLFSAGSVPLTLAVGRVRGQPPAAAGVPGLGAELP